LRPGCRAIGPGAGPLAQWPGLMQVVTVAGIVGAIAIDATAGWLHGFWPVAVIVIVIVLGEVLADQLATRLWGQPRRSEDQSRR